MPGFVAFLVVTAIWAGVASYERIPLVSSSGTAAQSRVLLFRTIAVVAALAVTGAACALIIAPSQTGVAPVRSWLGSALLAIGTAFCLGGAARTATGSRRRTTSCA